MLCAPRYVNLAEAQQRLPFLERAREIQQDTAHLAWGPLNDHPCWVWSGWIDDAGYGRVRWGNQNSARVHRVVFNEIRGSLNEDYVLDHLCRTRTCCNPWHLQPITIAENTQRGARAEGWCRNGLHEMTEDNVIVRMRDGLPRYECRACKNRRAGSAA